MIYISPGATAADRHSFGSGIDARVFNRFEIDHEGFIGNAKSAGVVSASTNGEKQIIFAREIHARDHVRDIHTLRDQTRLLVDHRVINFARLIVIRIGRLDNSPSQFGL